MPADVLKLPGTVPAELLLGTKVRRYCTLGTVR